MDVNPSNQDYSYRFIPHKDFGGVAVTTVEGFPGIRGAVVGGTEYSGSAVARHLETINILFVDGHVKAQRIEAIAKKSGNLFPVLSIEAD